MKHLRISQQFLFRQDNASCYTAKSVQNYFKQEDVQVTKWSAQSPNLDSIENLWHISEENVRKEQNSTVTDLKNEIEQEWKKI